jgi:nucleoside-diphosphate-sugar epimerase
VNSPAAAGCWLVSDGEDLSVPELLRRLGRAMDRRVRLVPVPPALLRLGAALVGRGGEAQRLCGSLVVDISETRERLLWSPPVCVDEGLARTVRWYLSQRRGADG